MKNNKYILWTNHPAEADIDNIADAMFDTYNAEYYGGAMTRADALAEAEAVLDSYLDDLRTDLSRLYTAGPVVVLASLGLWKGRVPAYKELNSCKVSDCLQLGSDDMYITIYMDALDDLRIDGVHHDGTNYYLFRSFKPELSAEQIDNFLNKVYNGKATRRDITRYTDSIGKLIKERYNDNRFSFFNA